MATSFDEVIDLALISIEDYKFNKAFKQGLEVFQNYCDGFLIRGIPYFSPKCKQSLEYNTDTREFVSDLTTTEKSILADLFKIMWYEKERNDPTKINALLEPSGSGFKTHSAAQNLKEKTVTIDGLREKVMQRIDNDYQLEYLDSIDI